MPFLVIVALDHAGIPDTPRAFLTAPGQGINIAMNTWHGVLTPLEKSADFLVVDRGGDGNNLEEYTFRYPLHRPASGLTLYLFAEFFHRSSIKPPHRSRLRAAGHVRHDGRERSMIANMLLRLGAVLATLVAHLVPGYAAERTVTFTGEVTYRERIALPPDAGLRVTLMSLSGTEPSPVAGATATIAAPGQVPLQFALNVRSDVLSDDGRYGLRAEILSRRHRAVPQRRPAPVDPAAPQPGADHRQSRTAHAGLRGPSRPGRTRCQRGPVRHHLAGAQHCRGRRDRGNPSCRSPSPPTAAPAAMAAATITSPRPAFDGPALTFGPVAGTRMACAPDVMAQEAAFFSALSQTARYEIEAETLYLLDADGNQLLRLVRGQ